MTSDRHHESQTETSAGSPRSTRRELIRFTAGGLTTAALATLLAREGSATPARAPRPRARRVIHVCLCGGLSHVDSFDPKPELTRHHGKPLPSSERPATFFNRIGLLRRQDWEFERRGKSGLEVSNLFPHLAGVADELTVIRSMVAESANHTPATFQENTGFQLNGFPVMGSWISYGLGSDTDDLPAYVVLPDARGYPAAGTINWSSGFLPSRHQGVVFRSRGPAIADLFPARPLSREREAADRALLARLNRDDARRHGHEDALMARLESYELAARMQLTVPEVTDTSGEPPEVQELYGLGREPTADFGRSCLLARRLVEKGVRFVQLFSGGSFGSPRINWDGHEDVKKNHTREAARIDRPVAGLLRDLKRRGLLDDTLVLFTTEFGRTPFSESAADQVGTGRDHNMYGFSLWMAGAGLPGGVAHGATDAVGWKAVEKPVSWPDFHATVLYLLGIDHEELTFYHDGIERRLTNVHGHVIRDLVG